MTDGSPPAGGAADSLGVAVAAFVRRQAPPAPYTVTTVGTYRALCLPAPAADAPAAGAGPPVLLLAGEDGAVYAPFRAPGDGAGGEGPGAALEAALRQARLRPTSTTLTLRLPPAASGGAAGNGGAPRAASFTLWASPAYLAGAGAGGVVWK